MLLSEIENYGSNKFQRVGSQEVGKAMLRDSAKRYNRSHAEGIPYQKFDYITTPLFFFYARLKSPSDPAESPFQQDQELSEIFTALRALSNELGYFSVSYREALHSVRAADK
jgi:hypothetical protein